MKLNIRKDYLLLDDHTLEAFIIKKLKPLSKQAGDSKYNMGLGLKGFIAKGLLPYYPDYLPRDLIDTFKKIEKTNAHL